VPRSGATVGFVSAIGAVLWGVVHLRRCARDAEERRALGVFGVANTVLVGLTFVAWELAMRMWPGEAALLIPWTVFACVLTASYQVWLPRIIARRLELERLEDETAAARQSGERLRKLIGNAVGVLLGLAGVLSHLFWR
jgi:hypothetical protein